MSRLSLAEFIETECGPRLTAAEVYGELRFDDPRRHYLRAPCPFAKGKASRGPFVVDAKTLRWSCLEHCGRGGQSVLAYLNGGQFPRPGTGELAAVVEKAVRIAGLPPAAIPTITPDAERELVAGERVASLLETFFHQARWLLKSAPASAHHSVGTFLARHGFDVEQLDDFPIGLAADMPTVHHALEEAGYSAQEIEASSLAADDRLAGRLIGPIRDRYGRILSFWARDPLDRAPKFLFKGPWKEQTALVGLDAAFGAAGGERNHLDDLLVFERLFDALVLHGLGFPQAAAIAGPASDMTPARWERLAAVGVRRVTLVPDDSESSARNVLAAVENAFRAKRAPAVWVLMPEVLGRHPTAVDLARARGLPEFQSVLQARVVHAYHYKALAVLKKHRPDSGWDDSARHAAWKEAIEFHSTSDPKNRPELDSHFVPVIVAGLERSWETFQPLTQAPADDPPAERFAPRPPIPRPIATPCLSEKPANIEEQTSQGSLPTGRNGLGLRGPASRNGINGYCRIHRCDTTVCFCFD